MPPMPQLSPPQSGTTTQHLKGHMPYEHDIFISYRRNTETLAWIKRHFEPLLKLRVGLELGRDTDVYLDEQLESGTTWPVQLARELAASRILIPLWTKTYFNSIWCTEEMGHMVSREEETGRRSRDNPSGLIIPTIIHDGEQFPPNLSHMQRIEIQRFFNVRMREDSPRAEELDDVINGAAQGIANAISSATPYSATGRVLEPGLFHL